MIKFKFCLRTKIVPSANILGFMTMVVQGLFVIFPPFGKVWKPSVTALKTTAITENDHNKAGSNHTYIRQKGQVIIEV